MNPLSHEAAIDACEELIRYQKGDTIALKRATHAAHSALLMDRANQEWRVLVRLPLVHLETYRWTDSGEGPWESVFEAEAWAQDLTESYKLACVIPELSQC